nr:MAG TPA: hypothetical protein [Caudoviricetes sp.]
MAPNVADFIVINVVKLLETRHLLGAKIKRSISQHLLRLQD